MTHQQAFFNKLGSEGKVFSKRLYPSALTLDFCLVLGLLHAHIEDSEGFVASVPGVVDDSQSGRLGGYEDSRLASGDWHRLTQRIFIFQRRGQTLAADHLATHQMTDIPRNALQPDLFAQQGCGNREHTRTDRRWKHTKTNTFGLKSSFSLVPATIHFLSGETRRTLTLKLSHIIKLDFLVRVELASVHTDP